MPPNSRAPNATAALLGAPPRVAAPGPPPDAQLAGEEDAPDWSALLVGNDLGPAGSVAEPPPPPPSAWSTLSPAPPSRPAPPARPAPPLARPAPPLARPAPPLARPANAAPPASFRAPLMAEPITDLGALGSIEALGGLDELGSLEELGSLDGQGLDGLGLEALGPDAVGLGQLAGGVTDDFTSEGPADGGASEFEDPAHAWLAALEPDAAGDLGGLGDAHDLGGPEFGLGGGFDEPGPDVGGGRGRTPTGAGFVFGAEDAAGLSGGDDDPLDAPPPSGWRVRAANGLVYELPDVNAVVAWLEGKSELAGIVLARGNAVFQPVDAWPEVASRVRRGRPASAMAAETGGPDLDLDVEAGPRRSSASTTAVSAPRLAAARPGPDSDVKNARRARISVDAPLGFGWVLVAALGATAAAVLGAWLIGDSAPADEVDGVVATAALSDPEEAAVVSAIGTYEAGHFTGAAEQLAALRPTGDPRVERYLALALHRQGRDRDARAALERYRRAMVRVSGEHGRQVRKVRD